MIDIAFVVACQALPGEVLGEIAGDTRGSFTVLSGV